MPQIIGVTVEDVRFPTSLTGDGSDAMNKDGDYSAAYVTLHTDGIDTVDAPLAGHGLTFTIGRGNDIVVAAAQQQATRLVGWDVDVMAADMGAVYRFLTSDSQLRWLGPEKGVIHLSLAAVLNASWDLVARHAGRPLWQLLTDMSPEQLVDIADLRYLSDVLTREEAIDILRSREGTKDDRVAELARTGYPVYTTSAGWLGYGDDKLRKLCSEAVDAGYEYVKLKVGADLSDDIRRCSIAREIIGPDRKLMIDANQVWEVGQAVEWVQALARFEPLWIEEPTGPDDILGHAAIRRAVAPIGVATGEHCHNRVMFKQFFQADAIDFCQLDTGRLGSINEIVAVLLLAAKFNVPVCPHAGGVGLCEMVQHVSVLDYVAVSSDLTNRVTEFVDHLHEHFTDPCVVRDGGAGIGYVLPSRPGYSTQLRESSVTQYRFPDGSYWASAAASTLVSIGGGE
ncbi:enolase C-terminal domain-like protein [Actinopolymorpha sp. B9G3]|uniref:enolase C-terminal domain-like protein n=1 Tax=Actinopolymorpha sp. B9G3 TaxID=3158970 RepID=UPI0032D8B7A4